MAPLLSVLLPSSASYLLIQLFHLAMEHLIICTPSKIHALQHFFSNVLNLFSFHLRRKHLLATNLSIQFESKHKAKKMEAIGIFVYYFPPAEESTNGLLNACPVLSASSSVIFWTSFL